MHSQAMPVNQHGETALWPRLYDEQLPSEFHLWPFILPWDYTQYPVLYDHQHPWRSCCIGIGTDPWCEDHMWYSKMNSTKPQFLSGAHEVERVLCCDVQCHGHVRVCLRLGMCYILVLMELQHICRMDTQGDKSLLDA